MTDAPLAGLIVPRQQSSGTTEGSEAAATAAVKERGIEKIAVLVHLASSIFEPVGDEAADPLPESPAQVRVQVD